MTEVIEACVESLDAALAAERGGADRLELCANLDVGGVTPSAELLTAVKSHVGIPVFTMIRPRGGSFVYTPADRDEIRRDIAAMREHGADGLVLGMLDDRGCVDVHGMRNMLADEDGLPITFHRAFDAIAEQHAALDVLVELGIDRVLTSGGAASALAGADAIRSLVEHAGGRIRIMAGGGVRAHNARELVRLAGVRELHARCEVDALRIADIRRVVT